MTNLEILKAVQEALNPLRICLPLLFLFPLLFLEEQLQGLRDGKPQGHQETLQATLKEELLEEFREELIAKYPGDSMEPFRDEVLTELGGDPRGWEEARERLLKFARQAKRGGDPRVEFMEDLPEGVQRLQERFRERQEELLELQKLQKWNWLLGPLLKHPWGQVWPVLAAILPLGLGFVSVWGVSLPLSSRAVMVSLFLLAVGGVQIYGQCRSYRERTETRIEKARAAKRATNAEGKASLGRIRAESRVLEIGGELSALANAVRNTERRGRIERIRAERERIKGENRLIDLYVKIQSAIEGLESKIETLKLRVEDLASKED